MVGSKITEIRIVDDTQRNTLHSQLTDRRQRLEAVFQRSTEIPSHLIHLLREVDMALERMGNGSYGLCEACHEPIETERLLADPLVRLCLDHLTPEQQRAMEEDLQLASQIQKSLLPPVHLRFDGWKLNYVYRPAGPVSGDYCDLVKSDQDPDSFIFILGDVSGKGVAASMLMSHLHAIFHSLIAFDLPVNQLVSRANRLLCESSLATHYATLVCGKASKTGEVELCNAGHLPLLLIKADSVTPLESSAVPLGLFCEGEHAVTKIWLNSKDMLLLYTDGLSEAQHDSMEYGTERIAKMANQIRNADPEKLVNAYLHDLTKFLANAPPHDDLTLLAIQKD